MHYRVGKFILQLQYSLCHMDGEENRQADKTVCWYFKTVLDHQCQSTIGVQEPYD